MATPPTDLDAAREAAERNLRDVLALAIEYAPDSSDAMVVWDDGCELSRLMTEAYRRCLPQATFVEFGRVSPEEVLAGFESLAPGDLVVLVQSTSFRLAKFRIRLQLFQRSLAVIEHAHLERMGGEQVPIYVDALAYDPDYYRGVGAALKERIDRTRRAVLDSGGERLVFSAGLEPAKLNVGDYRTLPNVGGLYPIGEVFTESKELEAVAGRVRISCFGDSAFTVNRPRDPITMVIERGRVIAALDSTPEFDRVLAAIRADEGEVWLREFGFGMNRAMSAKRIVSDIGTFERMCGVHFSLGAKHASYNKSDIKKRHARHHVDVFAVTEAVLLDGETVYSGGDWRVAALDDTRDPPRSS